MPAKELDAAIDARIRAREAEEWAQKNALRSPEPPAPGTWEGELVAVQQRKTQERRAAAAAEQERQRHVRERVEARKRAEWEANAPKREAARRELAALEPKLKTAEARLEALRDQESELEEVAR